MQVIVPPSYTHCAQSLVAGTRLPRASPERLVRARKHVPMAHDDAHAVAYGTCRPPRTHYEESDLGPRHFVIGQVFCVREDLTLTNSSGMQIHCRCIILGVSTQLRFAEVLRS